MLYEWGLEGEAISWHINIGYELGELPYYHYAAGIEELCLHKRSDFLHGSAKFLSSMVWLRHSI